MTLAAAVLDLEQALAELAPLLSARTQLELTLRLLALRRAAGLSLRLLQEIQRDLSAPATLDGEPEDAA